MLRYSFLGEGSVAPCGMRLLSPLGTFNRSMMTYKLRKGVKWSDGAPFISADIKLTWEAIGCAIDRKAIVDKVLFGKAQAGASEIAHGWAANRDLKPVACDPEKAK